MMFAFVGISPGPAELLFIFLILLLLFGAKNLPDLARQFGQILETFQRASRDVRREFTTPLPPTAPPRASSASPADRTEEADPMQEPDGEAPVAPALQKEDDDERVARDS